MHSAIGPSRPDKQSPRIAALTPGSTGCKGYSEFRTRHALSKWQTSSQAVLADHRRCPFTGQPLSWEHYTVLTHSNIERFKDRIIS